jgi:DNA-binding Lrp family transcriptional regulator
MRRKFMPRAYILVNVESGAEEQALNQIRNIDGVEESFVAYGVYDLVVRVKANTMSELKETITHKIRNSKQVRSTLTLIMLEE